MLGIAKKILQFWKRWLWGTSICAAICIIFYWDVLRAPAESIVGGNDLSNMFRIWLDFAKSSVRAGEFPLWNPYLFSGASFISDPQPALFYPPTWLALFMPTTRALGIILVFHIWWASVGTYGWLRSMNCSRWASISGAAIFAFSGYTFARVQAGHIGVITTGSWLPWGLWMVDRLTDSDSFRWRDLSFGAICVGMALLAGHIATAFYVLLMIGVYAIYKSWRSNKKKTSSTFSRIIFMFVMGFVLSSVQLIPFIKSITSSTRLGSADYEFASRFSWPVGYLVTLLVPNFFGEPVKTGYWGDGVYDEMIFYVGVLALFLLPLAWKAVRRGRFWIITGACSLVIAFGGYSIAHRLLVRFIPFFSSLRAPARAGFIFTIAMAVLAGLAITALQEADPKTREEWLNIYRKPWIGFLIAGAIMVVVAGFLLYAWGRDTNSAAGRFWHLANQTSMFCVLLGLSFAWVRAWNVSVLTKWLPILAAAIILFDLWSLGTQVVQVVPAPLNAYWRIVSENTDANTGRVLPWGLDILQQNGAMSYSVRSVFGYNPMEDQEYNDYTTSVADPRAKVYDLLNVAYVSTDSPIELDEGDTLSLLAKEHGVRIYSRSTAMPRVWMAAETVQVEDKNILDYINDSSYNPLQTTIVLPGETCSGKEPGTVQIKQEELNNLTATVDSNGGMVVFSERFAPGWQAFIDGKNVSLYRVDGLLRGVCAPAGKHSIELKYQPAFLAWGVVLSISALLVIVIGFVIPVRARKTSS